MSAKHSANPFVDAAGEPRCLLGVGLYSGAPRMAELACRIGYDVVWIEMEHGPTDFSQAESICYAALANGGLPLIRLPDASRNFVLKALEVGARILVAPMVNDAATAAQFVNHARFPPGGARGMNTNTPGAEFGLHGFRKVLDDTNQRIHLFAQIETRAAVDNLDAICQVEGLTGVFVGPSDLSVDLGWPGEFENPQLIDAVVDVLRRARAAGKLAGVLVPPGKLYAAARAAGPQLVIVGSDVSTLKTTWSALLNECRES